MSWLALPPSGSRVRYTTNHLSSRMHYCLRLRCWRTMTISYPSSWTATHLPTASEVWCHFACQMEVRSQSHSHQVVCHRQRRNASSWRRKRWLWYAGSSCSIYTSAEGASGYRVTRTSSRSPEARSVYLRDDKRTHTKMGAELSNEYKLEYRSGSRISHTDCMCMLPLPDAPSHVPVPHEVVLALSTIGETPINSDQIEKWTSADPVLPQFF